MKFTRAQYTELQSQSIELAKEGRYASEIAAMLGVNARRVRQWVRGYTQNRTMNALPDVEPSRPAEIPTSHLPGTSAKLNVLAERAMSGQELWHTMDRVTYSDSAE